MSFFLLIQNNIVFVNTEAEKDILYLDAGLVLSIDYDCICVCMNVICKDNFSPEGANGAFCVMIAIYFVKCLKFQWS